MDIWHDLLELAYCAPPDLPDAFEQRDRDILFGLVCKRARDVRPAVVQRYLPNVVERAALAHVRSLGHLACQQVTDLPMSRVPAVAGLPINRLGSGRKSQYVLPARDALRAMDCKCVTVGKVDATRRVVQIGPLHEACSPGSCAQRQALLVGVDHFQNTA